MSGPAGGGAEPWPAVGGAGRPFRVRPEARQIWLQHTGGTVGALLQHQQQPQQRPQPQQAGRQTAGLGTDCVSTREKLRTNRSQGRQNGVGRQPMRALPINGVAEEALSCSRSSSSVASFAASPRSPRRQLGADRPDGQPDAVEGVRGVRVLSPPAGLRPAQPGGEGFPSPALNGREGFPSPGLNGRESFPSPTPNGGGGIPSCGGGGAPWPRGSSPRDADAASPPAPGGDANGKLPPAEAAHGVSPRADAGGLPSPLAGGGDLPAWAAGSERGRAVRLAAPDEELRAQSDIRRERIRCLIGSLRQPPEEAVTAGRAARCPAAPPAAEPAGTRFSDETRLSFRELARERAAAPYRSGAPSIAASRKFKSSEALRDGAAAGRPAAAAPPRLLSRRLSQSVTRLAAPPPPPEKPAAKGGSVTRLAPPPPESGRSAGGGGSDRLEAAARHSQTSSETKPSVDFVRLNRQLAASQRGRRARSLPRAEPAGRPQPGVVPRYLVRRQEEWRRREEERLRSAPDPACPPNHSRMPDSERLSTLEVLRENQQTLLDELRALPIAHTSSRLVAQRADIEKQLQKIEEGIRIFSRPKVFIRNET